MCRHVIPDAAGSTGSTVAKFGFRPFGSGILLGITAVVIMLKSPRGLWGLVAKRYGLRFLPVPCRIHFEDDSKNDSS